MDSRTAFWLCKGHYVLDYYNVFQLVVKFVFFVTCTLFRPDSIANVNQKSVDYGSTTFEKYQQTLSFIIVLFLAAFLSALLRQDK